eukprot:14604-Heterococcus_DN1.PRE.1
MQMTDSAPGCALLKEHCFELLLAVAAAELTSEVESHATLTATAIAGAATTDAVVYGCLVVCCAPLQLLCCVYTHLPQITAARQTN